MKSQQNNNSKLVWDKKKIGLILILLITVSALGYYIIAKETPKETLKETTKILQTKTPSTNNVRSWLPATSTQYEKKYIPLQNETTITGALNEK